MAEPNKISKLEAMRKAIQEKPRTQPDRPPQSNKTGKVAAAVTPAGPKKPRRINPRSAPARDLRAKTRGRLPDYTTFDAEWNGKEWSGELAVWVRLPYINERVLEMSFIGTADGLFRLAEELDIKFWEWYAKEATDEQKTRLVFAPESPAPAPYQSPSRPDGTASGPR